MIAPGQALHVAREAEKVELIRLGELVRDSPDANGDINEARVRALLAQREVNVALQLWQASRQQIIEDYDQEDDGGDYEDYKDYDWGY